jgi:type III secretion protein R
MQSMDPISLSLAFALFGLVPVLIVTTTAFLKIAVVLSLLRNALGIQQIPPNIALYSLALILSAYVMAPVATDMFEAVKGTPNAMKDVEVLFDTVQKGSQPMKAFMLKHSKLEQRDFFVGTAKRLWPPKHAERVKSDDFLVLMPAFVVSELTAAFEIGFLLYLPFIVIDLVVSNILLAMGMMMVSPTTISLPLKLFLFVLVDGWTRLIHGLVMTYV